MAIIKANEPMLARPVIIFIYGTPGVGKTSLFNTSKNPLLIDCDRGSDRAIFRRDTLVARRWSDILADESSIKDYDTVGIDTAKAMLDDFLMEHVREQDYKLRTNTIKAYGAIGDEFKSFVNRRRTEDLDIVVMAHAIEEKDGDTTKFSPEVTGQSKQLLLRIADQVGFITMVNGRRTITFEPTDRIVGKNVARIPTTEIPDENDPKFGNFMADIIERVREKIHSMTEEQRLAVEKLQELEHLIATAETLENIEAIADEISSLSLGKARKAGLLKLILDRGKEIGIEYDKTAKKFVQCTTQE